MEMRPENELRPGGHKIGKSVHVVHNRGPVWVKIFPMGAKVPAIQPACEPAMSSVLDLSCQNLFFQEASFPINFSYVDGSFGPKFVIVMKK